MPPETEFRHKNELEQKKHLSSLERMMAGCETVLAAQTSVTVQCREDNQDVMTDRRFKRRH